MKKHPASSLRRRILWGMLCLFIVLLVLAPILWVSLLPRYVVSMIRSRTGFGVTMTEFSANPFTGRVHLRDLVLTNPEAWGGESFVELREFDAKTSVRALFSERYFAEVMVVDVARVNLVKNKDGVLNARAFKDGLKGSSDDTKPAAPKGFLVKRLAIKFDTLTYDNRADLLPGTRKYHLNVDTELTDVDSVPKLLAPFRDTAGVGLLTDTVGNLFRGSTDLLKGTVDLIGDVGKATGKTLKGVMDSLDKKKP
ncbi:MAG: hypothetical protein JWQ62_602 [Lacunisphaera sp.]|nr:hypothetical protein [Lacunisphaera sp.]